MRRKAIMVDVDGVIIVHPDPKGWSAKLKSELGIDAAALQRVFFEPHWDDVVHGRASLRERLGPALAELAPSVTSDELIDFWFRNDAHLDRRLLDELASLRSGGIEVHLATVQEHERANYLWHTLDFRSRFDGMHYAAALGCSKPDPTFFRSIEKATGLTPDAIFFIDDKVANVVGAQKCGWTAAVWTARESLGDLMTRQGWDFR